ncbi:MAG: DUF4397 domain-containing protein [Deltaproteobacteria bacterium]|nr:MAG: DUF4397 domain-containing protein [Deltaproteobacteria bacterium]
MNFPKFVWISVLGLIWFCLGCGSYKLDFDNPGQGPDPKQTSKPAGDTVELRMLHMSPGTSPVVVMRNRNSLFSTIRYGESSGYRAIPSGDHWFEVHDSLNEQRVLARVAKTLHLFPRYTALLVPRGTSFLWMLLQDSPGDNALGPNEVLVRFANAVPDSIRLDLKLATSAGAPLFSNVGALGASSYTTLPAATHSFVLSPTQMQGVLLAMEPVRLEPGGQYTITLYGTMSRKDEHRLKVRVFQDNVRTEGKTFVDL